MNYQAPLNCADFLDQVCDYSLKNDSAFYLLYYFCSDSGSSVMHT
jgi:hypothetical protein